MFIGKEISVGEDRLLCEFSPQYNMTRIELFSLRLAAWCSGKAICKCTALRWLWQTAVDVRIHSKLGKLKRKKKNLANATHLEGLELIELPSLGKTGLT
jgi:hypothetical protein